MFQTKPSLFTTDGEINAIAVFVYKKNGNGDLLVTIKFA